MKLFKKSVSVFLALLMIFGSVSLLATAADATYNWEVDTKFYRYDGTEWVETTKAARGESVKARVFLKTDFALGASNIFFFYPTTFLTQDTTNYEEGTSSSNYKLITNTDTATKVYESGMSGYFTFGTDVSGIFDEMVYEGYLTEDDIENKGWLYINLPTASKAVVLDGSEWLLEFHFTVNEDATDDGQFYISTECISDYDNWMAATVIAAQPDGEGGSFVKGLDNSCDVDTGTFAYTLNDTDEDSSLSCDNTVVFATDNGTVSGTTEYTGYIGDTLSTISGFSIPTATADGKQFLGWSTDGSTVLTADEINALEIGYEPITLKAVFQAAEASYKQNVYTMGTDGNYPETAVSTDIGASTGAVVNVSTYSVPAGFTLDADKSTAGDVTVTADGTAALDIYLKRNQYKATFGETSSDVYYEATYAAPAGPDNEGYTFTGWETTDADGGTVVLQAGETATMGLADVTYTATYAPAANKATIVINYVDQVTGEAKTVNMEVASTTENTVAIVEEVPAEPAANTTYVTYAELTAITHYEFTAEGSELTAEVAADGSTTLNVNYVPVEYTATFTGAVENETITEPYYTEITAPAAPEVAGQTFEGWTVNGTDVAVKAGETVKLEGDVTYTAKYSATNYTVTYVFDGASPAGVSVPAQVTDANMGDAVVLPDMSADGWTFDGWTVTGAVADGDAYKVGTEAVTVTGTWIENTYTIKFWLDEAKTKQYGETLEYAYGDIVEFPADPEDSDLEDAGIYGKYFDFWDGSTIDEIDNAVIYDNNGKLLYFTEVSKGNYVYELVAQLADYEYIVTFICANPAGGFATTRLEGLYYGDTVTADDIPDTDLEGYTFSYWMIGSEKVTEWTDYEVTGSVQVRAYFTVNVYEAVFYGNGGAWLDDDNNPTIESVTLEFEYEEQITAPTSNPVRTGYHLDADMPWGAELGIMDIEDQEFYANWVANEYTITFVVEGTSTESTQAYGGKIAVPAGVVTDDTVKPGYTFSGWTADGGVTVISDITTVDVPAADTTYTAVFVPSAGGVDYKVNRYFMNTDGNYDGVEADTVTLHEVAETEVTYSAAVDGFTLDTAKGNLTATVAGDGTTVLNAYYERNKYTANFVANGVTVDTAEVYYDAAIEASDYAEAAAGYALIGWSTTEGATSADADLGKMGTNGATFYAVYRATDAAYTVEIYLMDTNGQYGAAADSIAKTGTTDTLATADHAEYAQDAYFSADDAAANVTSAIINGDGTTVLKLYYKRAQYNVTVDGADAGAVYHGAEFTTPTTTTVTVDGYTFTGWTDGTNTYAPGASVVVTDALALETVNTPNADTAYTVEIYLMDTNGQYGAAADSIAKAGTTDTLATAAHADYAQDAYFSADDAAANVTSANINGDGTTVLKLYYKRAQYNVTVDGEDAGVVYHGATFTTPEESTTTNNGYTLTGWTDGANTYALSEDVTVTGALALEAINTANEYTVTFVADGATVATGKYAYGTKISTIAPAYTAPSGYTFEGWSTDGSTVIEFTDDVTVPVDGVTYYAVLKANSGVKYTIKTYLQNIGGAGYAPQADEVAYGTTGEEITYVPAAKEGFTLDTAQSSLTIAALAGDGSSVIRVFYNRNQVKVTIDGEENTYYYGDTIEQEDPVPAPGYTFDKWVDEDGSTVTFPFTVPNEDVVITSVYAPIQYAVTFTVNGEEYATGMYDYNSDIVAPEDDPTVAGYTFEGWSTDGATVLANLGKVALNGNTFQAVLTPNSGIPYTVKKVFQSLDGSSWNEPVDDVRTGTAGDTVALVAANENAEGFAVYKIDPASTTIAGDGSTVVYIYYTRNKVSVTIDGEKKNYYYGTEIAEPADVEKEGYDFIGWVDENGDSVTFPVTVPAEDLVITSVYEAQTKSLSFEIDGVTVAGYPTTAKVDSEITAPADPEKDGYAFVGWYIKGTSTAFNGKMPTSDTVYEAKWTAGTNTKYTIEIYMMDTDGQYSIVTSTVSYGVTGTLAEIVPNDDNIVGFTHDASLSELSKLIEADGSTVLKIYYARDLYTVTWVVDGLETEAEVYYGAAIETPADPVKTGYTFTGWTPEVPATMPAEDAEFTATWAETEYTITYVVDGTKTTETYKYGETVTVKEAPSAEGMTFDGWFDGNTEYIAGTTFTMPANDLIIVADFSVGVYKVTFLDATGAVYAAEMVKFGDTIPVPVTEPTKENYVFIGWELYYTTMPAEDIVVAPIFERIPVRLIPMDGSTTVIDRDNMIIYGLQEYLSENILLGDYLDVEGDGYIKIVPIKTGYYGTGAKVELYDNLTPDAPVETYTIVVFGDINGDSLVQAIDSTYADDENLMLTTWSQQQIFDGTAIVDNPDYDLYKTMAADLNGDGIIDSTDATIISDASIGIVIIDQVTGRTA